MKRLLAVTLCCYLPMAALAGDNPQVRITTSLGDIVAELYPEKAPKTVDNFLRLIEDEFYNGLIFHRVVANFVIQVGGYDANMNHREAPRMVVNESSNGLSNRKGSLAMARLQDPDSANAQFYINAKDNNSLDGSPGKPGYSVFGQVIEGMDVVIEIELSDTGVRAGMEGVPDTPIVVEKVERLD